MSHWNRQENDRLSRKFSKLLNKNVVSDMKRKQLSEEVDAQVQKSKDICNRKLVYNLSDKQIPKETEELIGRLGFNFQFSLKKFPTMEVTQATELCCQKIEKASTGGDE
jgi:hypothetical protein